VSRRAAGARRRALVLALTAGVLPGALALTGAAPASAAKTWDQASLWSFVDRRQADVDPRWMADRGTYMPVGNTDDVRLDANMLSVHAAAAKAGHDGPARHDERVRALADLLTRAPAFLSPPAQRDGGQGHVPGWSSSSVDKGAQHVAIDPQVAAALAAAWDVRDVVGLPQGVRDRIVTALRSVADSGFFRYPAMFLNQFNWQSDIAIYAAQVTGDPRYLAEYRQQLLRFVAGTRTALVPGRTPFVNAGLGIIYFPRVAGAAGSALVSTSEYENLIFSGLRHYDEAVADGMEPLPGPDEARLREWSQRVAYGDWTHAGQLNWDTSLGTRRWHLARYWAFALQGTETLATARRLTGSPAQASWGAWLAGRALETYETLAARQPTGMLPSGMWGIAGRDASPQADPVFTASRFSAHAARLAALRLGDRRAVRPPGWFALDPDAGRLAVSTIRYSTGVLLRHPTDDLGGIELSRLYDGRGEPVSGTGGSGASAFGLSLGAGGRARLDTQPGRNGALRGVQRLSVRQNGASATRGTFDTGLVVRSSTRNTVAGVSVEQTFDEDGVTVRRVVRSGRRATAALRLPAWGNSARFWALDAKGRRTRIGPGSLSLKRARTIVVDTKRGGYRVGLCGLPKGARVRLTTVAPVATSPSTTLVAQIRFGVERGTPRSATLRIEPTIETPRGVLRCRG
jgi:hypothetical protein